MDDLIDELNERGWEYDFDGYVLHIIYRNEEKFISTDDEAKDFLEEISW